MSLTLFRYDMGVTILEAGYMVRGATDYWVCEARPTVYVFVTRWCVPPKARMTMQSMMNQSISYCRDGSRHLLLHSTGGKMTPNSIAAFPLEQAGMVWRSSFVVFESMKSAPCGERSSGGATAYL